MKILLFNPAVRENRPPFNFPLGFGILAAIMRDEGHEVTVYDQNALRTSPEKALQDIKKIRNVDLVGTGGLITVYGSIKKMVPGLKEIFRSAKIVVGGGVTVEPEVIFKNISVDFCVHGEGENTFPELCSALENSKRGLSKIKGLSYVKSGILQRTAPREVEKDLDRFPMPAYDLFPSEIYFKNNLLKNSLGMDVNTKQCATLMWSRGCPNQCTFCWRMMGRGVRFRSFDLILKEIGHLRSTYNVDSYLFVDECINSNKNMSKAFANLLIRNGYDAPWYSHARVTPFDEEMAALFRRSGCIGLNFGIESASPLMLKAMNKKANPEEASLAVNTARSAGIVPVCTFIIGMPGETKETMKDSIRWIRKNRIQRSTFFFATPYPGCDLYQMPLVQNRILKKYGTWDHYFSILGDATDFTVNLTDLTDKQLLLLKRNAVFKIFLLTPQKWFKLLFTPKWWIVFIKHLRKLLTQ